MQFSDILRGALLGAVFSITALTVTAEPVLGAKAAANEHALACLADLNRDCALRAAVQTAIDEELSLEKANVLISVAEALIVLGERDQGLRTLELALSEARSARLLLVTQEKIRTIAPLMAQGGDVAGALALVQEIQIASVRDQVLEAIAGQAILGGDLATAQVALGQMASKERSFWRTLELYLRAPKNLLAAVNLLPFVEQIEAEQRPDLRYRGLVTLGLIEQRRGNMVQGNALLAGADRLYDSMVSAQALANMASLKLRAFYEAGVEADALEAAFGAADFPTSRVGAAGMVNYANRVGPIEAATGRIDAALARLELFTDLEAKATYLARLEVGTPSASLANAINGLVSEIAELESLFERDSLRLRLVRSAIAARDVDLGAALVGSLEDDDNQAIGLALLATLL